MEQSYFHGAKKPFPYFEGWYLKHQYMGNTISFIPAVHADKDGNWTASLQVIQNDGAWNFTYPIQLCKTSRKRFQVRIGDNLFSDRGIAVNIHTKELSVQGKIEYSQIRKIQGDIMGPFRYFPFMQCNHGIISMSHELGGSLEVNGEKLDFTGGTGYTETDWGISFPKNYLWTQANFGPNGRNSIMVSAADIPFLGTHFQGCICAVHYKGREYKMATYFGARIILCKSGKLILKQGNKLLAVTRLDEQSHNLKAPVNGRMDRVIRESPACRVKYQFCIGKKQVFQIASGKAAFEQAFSEL